MSVAEENTTSRVWPHLTADGGLEPPVGPISNKTQFNSMTAVGLNSFVAVAVLVNNTLLLVTLARTRKLWTSTNAYIASLAAADLLVGIMMVVRNFWVIPQTSWVFHNHEYVCMPIVCLLYVSCLESITCLTLVSFDRYAYIVYPYWYERHVTKRFIMVSIVLSWVVSIAIGFLPMKLNKFSVESGCDPLAIISWEYLTIGLNLYLFGAEVLIAAMYGRIFCVGNIHRKKIEATAGYVGKAKAKTRDPRRSVGKGVEGGGGDSDKPVIRGPIVRSKADEREASVTIIGLSWRDTGGVCRESNGVSNDSSPGGDSHTSSELVNSGNATGYITGAGGGGYKLFALKNGKGGRPDRGELVKEGTNLQLANVNPSGGNRKRSSIVKWMLKIRNLKRFSLKSTCGSVGSRWQVIRFLILVCGLFFLCWTPLQIISILYFTVGTPVITISISISFAAINSALNMYVMILMNKTFKAALFKMVCPASCLSRNGGLSRWARDDVEFVSDFKPAPKVSSSVEGEGSPHRADSGALFDGYHPEINSVDINEGSRHHLRSVLVGEGLQNQMDNVVVVITPHHEMDNVVIEKGSTHDEDCRTIDEGTQHQMDNVVIDEGSQHQMDKVVIDEGYQHRIDNEAIIKYSEYPIDEFVEGEVPQYRVNVLAAEEESPQDVFSVATETGSLYNVENIAKEPENDSLRPLKNVANGDESPYRAEFLRVAEGSPHFRVTREAHPTPVDYGNTEEESTQHADYLAAEGYSSSHVDFAPIHVENLVPRSPIRLNSVRVRAWSPIPSVDSVMAEEQCPNSVDSLNGSEVSSILVDPVNVREGSPVRSDSVITGEKPLIEADSVSVGDGSPIPVDSSNILEVSPSRTNLVKVGGKSPHRTNSVKLGEMPPQKANSIVDVEGNPHNHLHSLSKREQSPSRTDSMTVREVCSLEE